MTNTPTPAVTQVSAGKDGLVERLERLSHRYLNEAYGEPVGEALRSAICRILDQADRITELEARVAVTDERVERAARAFAEASGYYQPFHRGLSSASADKLRAGIRAALASSVVGEGL